MPSSVSYTHLPLDPGPSKRPGRSWRPYLIVVVLLSAALAVVNHKTPSHVKEEWVSGWKNRVGSSSSSASVAGKVSKGEVMDVPGTVVELPAIGRHSSSVIFLHGLGLNAGQSAPFIQRIRRKLFQATWQMPNAYRKPIKAIDGKVVPAWFDMDHLVNEPGSPLPPTIDVDSMKEAVSRVHALIDQELDRGIESQRIVLAGFSQGCAISLLSLLSTKHKVGGLMCLSGWLPMIDEIHRDANGTMHPMQIPEAKPVPIFWGHGLADTTIPPTWGAETRKALKTLGYKRVEAREYEGAGHWLPDSELKDMHEWLNKIIPPV